VSESFQPGSVDLSELPVILTVDELAALLRCDRKTLYAAIGRGEIPGVRRLGNVIRIHRDAVLRWLADGQGRAPRSRGSR
jgi:excisionase family DNA binding protein